MEEEFHGVRGEYDRDCYGEFGVDFEEKPAGATATAQTTPPPLVIQAMPKFRPHPMACGAAPVLLWIHPAGEAMRVASDAAAPVWIHPTRGAKRANTQAVPAPIVRKSVPAVSTPVVPARNKDVCPLCGVRGDGEMI